MASTSIPLHRSKSRNSTSSNPLPQLLQTPSGFALLELQGTINLPETDSSATSIPIGHIDFPGYRADALDLSSTAWMKRVYLYVGQHQRLTGEVKKLPKPVAVIRRRSEGSDEVADELEVVEIVKYKLVFSNRPEPVSSTSAA